MLDRLSRTLWNVRQRIDRSRWTARLLAVPDDSAGGRGLVLVQIDGLSRSVLQDAMESGSMPHLADLLADGRYLVRTVYSGVPSSTPVAQAELFYGVPVAVPGYEYVDRESGRLVRMSHPDIAAIVEARLADRRPLLEGGASYGNVYRGGAAEARFCVSSLEWTDPFRTRHPLALPALGLLYGADLVRIAAVIGRECLAAPAIFVDGLRRGQDLRSELKFAFSRLAVAVVMRELIALSTRIDIARGIPVIYLDLIGYDESAHRRGPASPLARGALADIDAVIARLHNAAGDSSRRRYDLWILSDHGQERTESYVERHGQTVSAAIASVFRSAGIPADRDDERPAQRARAFIRRVVRFRLSNLGDTGEVWAPGKLTVAAQGPLGHVYAPRRLEVDERDAIATALVDDAGIPLVLATDGEGRARAWTPGRSHVLPDDARAVLGAVHPFLNDAAEELVALCHHPDAGNLIISGWRADGASPVSFPHENGSHGGPGPTETEAFALLPADVPLVHPRSSPLRPGDIRRAALDVRDGALEAGSDMANEQPRSRAPNTIRIMTYNVHSCIGLDGVLSPDRIVRVIAAYDPDVVALQELDVARPRTGGVDQAQFIADGLEMLLHFHPAMSVGEERYGDAVLSRLPMRVAKADVLPGLRAGRLEQRGAIWVELGTPSSTVHLINTHLSLHPSERRLQVRALLSPDWLGAVGPGQVVLCGDFNALPWFPVCRQIRTRLVDVQSRHAGHRPRPTWQGGMRRGRIDHIFVDPGVEIGRVVVGDGSLARVASDHLPLVADLRLSPAL